MHRLFAKAKGHKGGPHATSSHNAQQHSRQQQGAEFDKKAAPRHVQIAEESKENYPAEAIPAQTTDDQRQARSFLSSSLPTNPAAVPPVPRRSASSEDHHLKAFEATRPGRIALSIAPELSEVKGQLLLQHAIAELTSD